MQMKATEKNNIVLWRYLVLHVFQIEWKGFHVQPQNWR